MLNLLSVHVNFPKRKNTYLYTFYTSYIPMTLLPYLTLPPAKNSLIKWKQLLSKVAVVLLVFYHFELYLDLDLDRLLLPDLDLLLDELECLPPLPLLEDLDFDLLDFPLRLLFPRLRLLDLEEELELELKLNWTLYFLVIKIQENNTYLLLDRR